MNSRQWSAKFACLQIFHLTMRMHLEATHVTAALTRRKIHDASEIEPKTPESASCAVKEGKSDIMAANMLLSTSRMTIDVVVIGRIISAIEGWKSSNMTQVQTEKDARQGLFRH
jgi:hypothetical protein